jgi:antitoxin component of RelBE/YafQ-DinJ toxin-antitoxin module
MASPKSKVLYVRIDGELHEHLAFVAREVGMTLTTVVVELLSRSVGIPTPSARLAQRIKELLDEDDDGL